MIVILRTPVESSNLVSIGYSVPLSLLDVEFKGGKVVRYSEVPFDVYMTLMTSESKGKFFSKEIRNVYRFAYLDEEGNVILTEEE